MSDQSPNDTVTDLIADCMDAEPRPRRLDEVAIWAGVAALASGGIWIAALAGWQRLVGPAPLDSLLVGGLFGTAGACAAIGGLYGLVVGAAAVCLRGTLPRARACATWGLLFAAAGAAGGGPFPLVVATTAPSIPPELSSAVSWAVVGALVGALGYLQSHRRRTRSVEIEIGESREPWRLTGAAAWGIAVGGLAAGAWFGELAVLRLLPDSVALGPLVRGYEVALAGPLAALAAGIGLAIGTTFGLILGSPSRLTAALLRGLGFMVLAAAGGGLFPLAVAATADWLAPEVSSALTWAVVCGVAGVLAYTWTRLPHPDEFARFDADGHGIAPADTIDKHPVPALTVSRRPAEPAITAGTSLASAGDDPSPVFMGGWEPEPERPPRSGPCSDLRVLPASRAVTSGAVARVAPVVMVSVVCLLAVGLSAPSVVGWAMLAVGLLGLASAAALVGQERRIRDLERRVSQPTEHSSREA